MRYKVKKDLVSFYRAEDVLTLKNGFYVKAEQKFCPYLTKKFVESMPKLFEKYQYEICLN